MKTLVLGCGPNGWRAGATNVDAVDYGALGIPNFMHLNFVGNMPAGRWDLIVLEDVLEHLGPEETRWTLNALREVIEPGGMVEVRVPNLDTIVAEYAAQRISIGEFCRLVYGSRDHEFNLHREGYNPARLKLVFESYGFETVRVVPRVKDATGRWNNCSITVRWPRG